MTKIYHKLQKYTTNESIRYFYYSRKKDKIDDLQFLQKKIDDLLQSQTTSESVKKQLQKLKSIDFNKYNCFYIYSNCIKYAIDNDFIYLFDKKFLCLFDKIVPANKIKFTKLAFSRGAESDAIDADELPTADAPNK